MAMSDYYHDWMKQELVRQPTGFPPPFAYEYIHGDGAVIEGTFILNQTAEMQAASAQGVRTTGTFATHPDVPLRSGDVLRDKQSDRYITILGDCLKSPPQAKSQVQRREARVSERGEVLTSEKA